MNKQKLSNILETLKESSYENNTSMSMTLSLTEWMDVFQALHYTAGDNILTTGPDEDYIYRDIAKKIGDKMESGEDRARIQWT